MAKTKLEHAKNVQARKLNEMLKHAHNEILFHLGVGSFLIFPNFLFLLFLFVSFSKKIAWEIWPLGMLQS